MYWFRRPPYLRWAVAAVIAAAAVVTELRGTPTVPHPFATAAIPAGAELTGAAVEFRQVPPGLLPEVDPAGARAARPVAAGDPLVPADLGTGPATPDGWWAVPVDLPDAAVAGQDVAVVLVDTGSTAPGFVVAATGDDGFGARTPGLVAVPEADAPAVAQAAARDALVVILAP